MAEHAVPQVEVVVGPPGREPGGADADRLEDAAGPQLLDGAPVVELEGRLVVVGLKHRGKRFTRA